MTFHLMGSTSSVSVVSSPSLESLPPQHGQAVGDGRTTRSRGRWAGAGRAVWAAGAALLVSCLLRLGGVLARSCHQLTEFELQLVDQLAAAFGGSTVLTALELGDEQLEVRDHCLSIGGACLSLAPRQPLGLKC